MYSTLFKNKISLIHSLSWTVVIGSNFCGKKHFTPNSIITKLRVPLSIEHLYTVQPLSVPNF